MAAAAGEKSYCSRCKKTLARNRFYTYHDGSAVELCKNCLTAHVNNFDPPTFLWILEKMDVPYIEPEWNSLRDAAYEKDPKKAGGSAVLGKYLGKMRLNQWKEKRWADTEAIAEQLRAAKQMSDEEEAAEKEKFETELKQALDEGKISEAQYKTLMPTETRAKEEFVDPFADLVASQPAQPEDEFMSEDELPDPAAELTDEDKIYLAMKWGRLYKPNEWVILETKFTEMMNSFDVQDADTRNTLMLMCKTDLKMNQCLDMGDIDGYQKLARVSDSLRKSGKFTAAQNKDKDNDQVDCVGKLIAVCERLEGFIPKFEVEAPQDIIDTIIEDNNKYVYKLVTQDLGFGQQIENYLKKIQIEHEAMTATTEEIENEVIEDEDIAQYYERIADEHDEDELVDENSSNSYYDKISRQEAEEDEDDPWD